MTPLRLRLLGDFEALTGTGMPVDVSAKKGRALLAIVALSTAGSTSRQRLANLLWGDRGDEQARGSLRQTLSSLRRDLAAVDAEILSADDETVALDRMHLGTDISDFTRLAHSDNVNDLHLAMSLYRGDLLADTTVHVREFEDWVSGERTRLHSLAVTSAERLWALEAGAGRIDIAKRVIALEPLKESAHRALMQSYAEAGENGLAIQHYSNCRDLLKVELGIAPGIEIERLRQKIMDQRVVSVTLEGVANTQVPMGKWTQDHSVSPRPNPALPNKPSIAVLPFANLSDKPGQDYFVDGMVEEIITTLSRFNWLFVIARNSSFIYRNKDVEVTQIGRELGVRYIMEGSVRKAGDLVRISGQLVDASTGANLWADRFDGELRNIFELQDQVAASVAGTIAPRLEQAEIERARRKPIASLEAYDYYLRGLSALHRWEQQANADALSNFYRAIELDPEFAPAYGLAARCYAQRRGSGWVTDRQRDIAEATRLARLAVDLGKNDAVALCTAGFALADVADEVEDGDAYIERALALNPNLAVAWLFSGWVKISLGDPEAAIPRLLHAMRLSPQDPHVFTMHAAMAWAHFSVGRYEEAFAWAEMAVRGKPTQLVTTAIAAASSALAGRRADSQKMLQYLRAAAPSLRLANLKDVMSFLPSKDFDRWIDGLRKAGLPE